MNWVFGGNWNNITELLKDKLFNFLINSYGLKAVVKAGLMQ